MSFPFNCPYCNHDSIIGEFNYSTKDHFFNNGNKDGHLALRTNVTVCPNPECKEYIISVYLFKAEIFTPSAIHIPKDRKPQVSWAIKPQSHAKQFPDYIPKPIIGDYEEACSIKNLSPKASATLSRRCIQGIIRDFWGISKGRLVDEIKDLKELIDPCTWQAIDGIRKIGNISAHMEKDINLVIDVDPDEAGLLISLIEILISDWYINRHDRQEKLQAIIEIAASKKI